MSFIADGVEVWKQIQHRLQGQLPRATHHTWVAHAEAVSLQDGLLTVAVGNAWARDRLAEIDPLPLLAREILGPQGNLSEKP